MSNYEYNPKQHIHNKLNINADNFLNGRKITFIKQTIIL